jgi:hypothetical protein
MDAFGDLELLFDDHLLSLPPIGENLLSLFLVRHSQPRFPRDN